MKNLKYSYSTESPLKILNLGKSYQLHFDIKEFTRLINDVEHKEFKCLYAQVDKLDYSLIISAIINIKYSANDIEAIILNYQEVLYGNLSNSKIIEYKQEYQELQDWRTYAKQVSRELMSSI